MATEKRGRGRPSYSLVRERLKEIVNVYNKITAYQAHKVYTGLFGNATRRNIYYQLRKGEELEEFKSKEVIENGEYSWGNKTRKVYYSLVTKNNNVEDMENLERITTNKEKLEKKNNESKN